MLRKIACTPAIILVAALLFTATLRADEWLLRSVEVADGGAFELEFPDTWGKKPETEMIEGIKTVRFGPYGPRKKPIFMVKLEAVVSVDPISEKDLLEITNVDVENFRKVAVETEIPINDVEGPHVRAHYFSITDKESKIGEFDYLTLGVMASGQLLVKSFFFSSDGAPDFGPDALRMMQSIKYVPPPEPEEDED